MRREGRDLLSFVRTANPNSAEDREVAQDLFTQVFGEWATRRLEWDCPVCDNKGLRNVVSSNDHGLVCRCWWGHFGERRFETERVLNHTFMLSMPESLARVGMIMHGGDDDNEDQS